MKKRFLFQALFLSILVLSLTSCPAGGVCAVGLIMEIHLQKPDGTPFTVEELKYFKCETTDGYGKLTDGTYSYGAGSVGDIDMTADGFFWADFYLGSASLGWKIKKLKESYREKIMRWEIDFKIEDPDFVYKDFELRHYKDWDTYEVLDADNLWIKYTIKLEENP